MHFTLPHQINGHPSHVQLPPDPQRWLARYLMRIGNATAPSRTPGRVCRPTRRRSWAHVGRIVWPARRIKRRIPLMPLAEKISNRPSLKLPTCSRSWSTSAGSASAPCSPAIWSSTCRRAAADASWLSRAAWMAACGRRCSKHAAYAPAWADDAQAFAVMGLLNCAGRTQHTSPSSATRNTAGVTQQA